MGDIITSTADILAILGGVTTFTAAVFAAVRLSRCQKVLCCWGGCQLENKPLPVPPTAAVPPLGGAAPYNPPSRALPYNPMDLEGPHLEGGAALTRGDSVDMGGIV